MVLFISILIGLCLVFHGFIGALFRGVLVTVVFGAAALYLLFFVLAFSH